MDMFISQFILDLLALVLWGGTIYAVYRLFNRIIELGMVPSQPEPDKQPELNDKPKGPPNHELPEDGQSRTGSIINV